MKYKVTNKVKLPTKIRSSLKLWKKTKEQRLAKPSKAEKYPMGTMQVGESFYVPNTNSEKSLNGVVYYAGLKYGNSYVVRQEKTGARVFRVA